MSQLPLTKEEVEALASRCWRSRVEFCRVFLPEWFPSQMPWVHRGLLALRTGRADFLLDFGEEWWPDDVKAGQPSHWTADMLAKIVANFVIELTPAKMEGGREITPAVVQPIFELDMDGPVITGVHILAPSLLHAFMLPRGYSKTTLLNAANLADIVYKEADFIVYVSETATHAERQLSTIRTQLENNELLRLVFGNLVPDRQSSLKWTDPLIETTNGQRAGAIGKGGQIRGMSKDAKRPSRIVLDDIQDQDSVKQEPQRDKDLDWLVRVVLPARKLFGDKLTSVDMVGTLLSPDALMAVVMQDEEWTRVRFGAIDRQGDPLWAFAMDLEKLEKLKQSFAAKGKLDAFDYEYMSSVPLNDGVALRLDKIIYVNHPDNWFVAKALVCDPAISDNPKADFCTFTAVGIGNVGKCHVIDLYAEVGMEFGAQVEKFFELHFAHMIGLPPDCLKHGVEAVAYQRALASQIKATQFEKSKTWGARAYFEVIPILHGRKGKIVRVQGILGPRLRAGHISAERHFPALESQMRDWPNGKKDAPDVVAMAIGLLDPFASLNANDNPESAPVSKLPPLRQVLGGKSFRHAP